MIATTFATAIIGATFMAGSHASPCKASSRTTDILTISEILYTTTSTEAAATAETIFSTSGVSSVEETTLTSSQFETGSETSTILDDSTTTTAISTPNPSSTLQDRSSGTSTISEATTTTDLSTTDLSSFVEESSTDISTSFEVTTTTALSTTDLSSTIEDTSTEFLIVTADATTTAISTTYPSSTIEESSTEIATDSTDALTTAISTTEISTTTAGSTTTTDEITTTTTAAAADPTFLLNGGFDDESDTIKPWIVTRPQNGPVSIDSTIKHDGRNSIKFMFIDGSSHSIAQELAAPVQAGITGYTASAWILPGSGCSSATFWCSYRTDRTVWSQMFNVYTLAGQWSQISIPCRYSQNLIDQGGLYLYIGLTCLKGSTAWIDSISFTPQMS